MLDSKLAFAFFLLKKLGILKNSCIFALGKVTKYGKS